MAQYINMQQTEYDEIQTKLAAIHEEILTGEETIRNKIAELIQIEGGFYVEKISSNVDLLLSRMKEVSDAQLKTAFQNTEQAVEAFADVIIQIDTAD
ncbi:MAG: hypothetical protein Q4D94_14580 [Bacillota bacterium]|nr:hypothetical protein [Bacillota bacterium]